MLHLESSFRYFRLMLDSLDTGFQREILVHEAALLRYAAHSLTLAVSALGLLTLRTPPVEATIALSIMLVASEALHNGMTLSISVASPLTGLLRVSPEC